VRAHLFEPADPRGIIVWHFVRTPGDVETVSTFRGGNGWPFSLAGTLR
jgi:hypothetical protein